MTKKAQRIDTKIRDGLKRIDETYHNRVLTHYWSDGLLMLDGNFTLEQLEKIVEIMKEANQ